MFIFSNVYLYVDFFHKVDITIYQYIRRYCKQREGKLDFLLGSIECTISRDITPRVEMVEQPEVASDLEVKQSTVTRIESNIEQSVFFFC